MKPAHIASRTTAPASTETAPLRETRLRDDGILDALATPVGPLSLSQRVFFNPLSARFYVVTREGTLAKVLNGHSPVEDDAWLVRALDLHQDSTVLDVPCGQGNLTAAIARALPQGRVIGLDLSDTMLRLARTRLERAGLLDRTLLVRADAQHLPLEDGSIDAVSACAGLHLFPEPDRAIAEMRRVLKPGGRVAGLVFVEHRDLPRRWAQAAVRRLTGMTAFDFDELGRRFEARGFTRWRWHRAGIVGYFQACAP